MELSFCLLLLYASIVILKLANFLSGRFATFPLHYNRVAITKKEKRLRQSKLFIR